MSLPRGSHVLSDDSAATNVAKDIITIAIFNLNQAETRLFLSWLLSTVKIILSRGFVPGRKECPQTP